MWRRAAVVALAILGALAVGLVVAELAGARAVARLGALAAEARPPIVVGLLHSLSGPLEPYERPLHDAEVRALEEINARGGVAGRLVRWVAADGRSDPRAFASQARRLIEDEKASVVIGGWTSECREAVRSVVEERGSLLIFPGEFEGLDRSPRVVYAGLSANQHVVPGVRWALDLLGARRPFLLASDEAWSRTAAAIARDQLGVSGVEPAGEATLPAEGGEVAAAAAAIAAARPDCVLNFLAGDANAALFPALREAGLAADRAPVLSFRLSDEDARRVGAAGLAGHYAARDAFDAAAPPAAGDPARRPEVRPGEGRSASAVGAFDAALLWAKAAEEAGDPDPSRVLEHLPGLSLDAPEGVVTVDPEILAAWRPIRVARARADGRFDVVWSIDRPIRPQLRTGTRAKAAWDAFLDELRSARRGGRPDRGPAGPPPRTRG